MLFCQLILLAFVTAFPAEISSNQGLVKSSDQTTTVTCTSCLSSSFLGKLFHHSGIPGLSRDETANVKRTMQYVLDKSKVKQRQLNEYLKDLEDFYYLARLEQLGQIHRDTQKWKDLETKARLGLEFVENNNQGDLDVEGLKKAMGSSAKFYYSAILLLGSPTTLMKALIAQLGERQTEDLKVLCSIHNEGTSFVNFKSGVKRLSYLGSFVVRNP
jgi:hypothetical protein